MKSLKNKCLAILLWAVSGFAWGQGAPAGNVIFASGEARIINAAGVGRDAVKGMAVTQGDTLVTGKAGALHVRMSDAGFIAMRPDTRLAVREFAWNGKEDGLEKSVLSLVQGGFRTITGVIGRRTKDNYQVITPTATIGIRGTDHEPHYIPPLAPGEKPAIQAEPGTYNKVNVGATFIRNGDGIVELGPNETGFASAKPGQAPLRLARLPVFMRNAPVPLNMPERDQSGEDGGPARRQMLPTRLSDWAEGEDERKRMALNLMRYAVVVANSNLDLSVPATQAFTLAPPGTAMVGGVTAPALSANGGTFVSPDNGTVLLLGPNARPLFIAAGGTDGFRYNRGVAPWVDGGSATVNSSDVTWGIYAGGDAFVSGVALNLRYFHFMLANNLSTLAQLQSTSGTTTASFTTVSGFTKPINEAGQVGGNVTLSVNLMFGASPQITQYNLQVTDAANRTWTAQLQTSQPLSSFAPSAGTGNNLNVTCSPVCGNTTATGKARGYVIGGANRDALLSSYGLSAGTASVTGSVVVK